MKSGNSMNLTIASSRIESGGRKFEGADKLMAIRVGLIVLGVVLVLGGFYFARQSRTGDDPGLGFAAMAFMVIGVVLALYGIVNPPHSARFRPALLQNASAPPAIPK